MTRLLISTYAGIVLWEDGDWRFLRRRPEGDPDFCFYGITWDDRGHIYVAESGIPYGKPGRIGIYWQGFKHLGVIGALDDLVTPHQILWYPETLYVANSGRNRIDTWFRKWKGQTTGHFKWLEANGDVDHVNSIWCDGVLGDERFYVVEHRRSLQPKRIRVFTRDWRVERTVEIPGVQGLHNVVVVDGTLVTLAHDKILTVKGDEVKPVSKFAVNGYLRGLACTADRWYVGMSQVRRRGERGKGPCQFHILDRDFGLVETVQLEDTGGVTEIRVVDEPDLCHNGIVCPLSL